MNERLFGLGAGRFEWTMPTFVLTFGCDGCGQCLEACALQAIKIEDGRAEIDPEVCRDCEACLEVCPREAIVQT